MKNDKAIKPKFFPALTHSILFSILSMIAIIVVTIFKVYTINCPSENVNYLAKKGVMDLSNWDVMQGKNINLNGEWEFYPEALLGPWEMSKAQLDYGKKYIGVPGTWGQYLSKDGNMEGSGTYRLKILLPSAGIYAVKTRTIRLSSRIYLNGQESIVTGNPSLSREGFKGESCYKIGVGNSLDKEIDLIVQVSSYGYKTGGILSPVEFGTIASIMKEDQRTRATEAMVIAVCLIAGVFFLILYLQRKKEPYLLYFGIANFMMAIYLSTMNEQLLRLVYNHDLFIRIKIQVASMLLTAILLLQFAYHFFKKYANEKVVKFLTCITLLFLLLLFVNSEELSPVAAAILQGTLVCGYIICYIKILFIMLKALVKRAESSGYILMITGSLILYWILIALKIIFEIYLGNVQVFLFLLMVVGAAALVTHRFNMEYKKVNDLTERMVRYDRQKDEFLAGVSHKVKAPLRILLNLTKNLMEGHKGALNPKQQEDLLFIQQEGQRLTRLMNNMLNASQIKKEKLAVTNVPMNLFKIVDDILKEMKIFIPGESPLVLKNLIPKDFPNVKGDPEKFGQIIYNLVQNAIRFTKEGSVAVSAVIIDEAVTVKVADTGIGIEEKDYEEIFHIFYRKNDEEKSDQGFGLGLAIVKQLVENQGGKITVESVYGEGTIFIFTLPFSERTAERSTAQDRPEKGFVQPESVFIKKGKTAEAELVSQRILIVDKDPLNQKILLGILEGLEWNIFLADCGTKALDIIENNKIDLVILDFMLPDIPGDKVCREIRKDHSMVELPVLILTASDSTVDLLKGFEHGANDFQRKPVDPEELISRIYSLLLMKKTAEKGLEKEFKYFYAQISPHFLFNTINTIIGLSYTDSEKARKALNNFSIYFRGKLDVHREKGLVPLEEELDLVRAYLEIEEMRYGERLGIDFDIEKDLKALIPSLTLQPIVENAIRHGIKVKNSKGTLRIAAKKGKKGLINIEIEDDGPGIDPAIQAKLIGGYSDRMGFKNVLDKIQQLKNAEIILESPAGNGTKVTIIIPEAKYDESYYY